MTDYRQRLPSQPDTQMLEVMPSNERNPELYRAARATGAWLVTVCGLQSRTIEQVEAVQRKQIVDAETFKLEQAAQNSEIAKQKADLDAQRLKWTILQLLATAVVTAVVGIVVAMVFKK